MKMTFGEFMKKYFTNCDRLLFYVGDYETSNFYYESDSLVLFSNSNTDYFDFSEPIEISEDKTDIIFANGLTIKISKIEDVLYI